MVHNNKDTEEIQKQLAELNNDLADNSKKFIFGYVDGQYGYYENEERGADTFHPFKKNGSITNVIQTTVNSISVGGGGNSTHYAKAQITLSAPEFSFDDEGRLIITQSESIVTYSWNGTSGSHTRDIVTILEL